MRVRARIHPLASRSLPQQFVDHKHADTENAGRKKINETGTKCWHNIITVVCSNCTCVHFVDQIFGYAQLRGWQGKTAQPTEKEEMQFNAQIKNNIRRGKQFNFFVNSLPDYHYYLGWRYNIERSFFLASHLSSDQKKRGGDVST